MECPRDAHTRGVFITSQRLADGTKITLLEETQHDGRAVGVIQFIDGGVEHRCDVGKV